MVYLTPKQKQVLEFVKSHIHLYARSPTYEEIGSELHICKVTVLEHIRQLEKKGYLRRIPHAARALEVCDKEQRGIPVAGTIQAGSPLLAFEEPDKLDLMDVVPMGEGLFALKVKGDSMLEDHIENGDFVLVRKSSTANAGDVVVALIDQEEATLKRFYPERDRVRLQPANKEFAPIVVERKRLTIQGQVIGVLRLYR